MPEWVIGILLFVAITGLAAEKVGKGVAIARGKNRKPDEHDEDNDEGGVEGDDN